jgi:type I restriction enzyme S subunit
VLIEAATGAEMRPYNVNIVRIYERNDRKKARLGSVPYYGANGRVGWIDEAIFNEPLLLIAEDGGHFGEPERGVAYTIRAPSWVNNHAHVLRPDESRVLLDFLGYHFRHFDFQPYITGTTRAKLTQRDLMRVEIPVPPVVEQERIVKLLDKADELRKLRAQSDYRTDTLMPALFHDMFGDPVANSRNWPTKELRQLGRIVTGGTPPSGKEGMFAGDIPFITPGDLDSNTRETQRFVTEAGAAEVRTVRAGSTLVCCIGATIGKTDRAWKRSAFNQQINAVEWNEQIDDDFGLMCMKQCSSIVIRQGSSTALPIIKKSLFERIQIPVPALELQKQFAGRVTEIRAMQSNQVASRTRLDELFQSMLHRVFNGEL